MCCRKIKVVRQRDKSGQAGIRENKSCRKRKFSSKKNLSGTEERLLFNEYVLKNLENAAGREAEPDELEDQAAVSDGIKSIRKREKKVLDYEVGISSCRKKIR